MSELTFLPKSRDEIVVRHGHDEIGRLTRSKNSWSPNDGGARVWSDVAHLMNDVANSLNLRQRMEFHFDGNFKKEQPGGGDRPLLMEHPIDPKLFSDVRPFLDILHKQHMSPHNTGLWVASSPEECTCVCFGGERLAELKLPPCGGSWSYLFPKSFAIAASNTFRSGEATLRVRTNSFEIEQAGLVLRSDTVLPESYFDYAKHFANDKKVRGKKFKASWSPAINRSQLLESVKKAHVFNRIDKSLVATVGFIDGKLYVGNDCTRLLDEVADAQTTVSLKWFLEAVKQAPKNAETVRIGVRADAVFLESSSFRYLQAARLPIDGEYIGPRERGRK